MRTLWPILVLPALGLIPYLLVHVEERYLGGILLLLTLLPMALVLNPKFVNKRPLLVLVLATYIAGAFAELEQYDGWTIKAALSHQDFHRDPQWRLARTLSSYGFEPGDTVALIGREGFNIRCSWAYVARIRVIAEFGSLPWSIEPWDRTPFDHSQSEEADENWGVVFWQLPQKQRERVINAFRRTGARAIISLTQPGPGSDGWTPLAGTGAWIYSLDPQLTASLAVVRRAA